LLKEEEQHSDIKMMIAIQLTNNNKHSDMIGDLQNDASKEDTTSKMPPLPIWKLDFHMEDLSMSSQEATHNIFRKVIGTPRVSR
jgi:hypothetical protein